MFTVVLLTAAFHLEDILYTLNIYRYFITILKGIRIFLFDYLNLFAAVQHALFGER